MKTSTHRGTSNLYYLDPSGKLGYSKDPKGNRLPDFSHVGYHSGEREIPHVPVKITLESRFRGNSGTGHGWAGTQTCFYNCTAPEFDVEAPPGGVSWVIGSGKSDEEGARVTPASLYYQQVQDRLGKAALDKLVTEEQQNHLGEYRWVKERLKNEKALNSETVNQMLKRKL